MPTNRQVPASESSEGAEEEDDDGSENEEVSNEEDSSEDSGHVAVKVNHSRLQQSSRNTNGGKISVTASTFGSSTEDGEEADSSSDSDQGSPPQTQAFASAEEDKITPPINRVRAVADDEDDGSEFISSSDETANPGRSPSRNYTDAPSKQRDSKPRGSHVQSADSSPGRKRSAASLALVSEKKRRTDGGVGSEGDEKKKDNFRRIWSSEDELALLRGILDYKESHRVIPSSLQQVESLLNSVKGSLSISASLNQMIDKIRRMKQKYMKAVKRIETAKNPNIPNAHDAAVFHLSRNIWGSRKEESAALNTNIKPKKIKNFKWENEKGSHFSEDYPSLNEFVKSEHENMASILSVNHIPMAKAKEFNGKAKVLEMTQFQIHQRKHTLIGAALELINNALAEC
ncbi:hypothetical protein HPP92_004589 [Vanilla planifolia]|uniref:Glabrous enhancer-binding protein-like DBD domain-containing protein n=1 Tax=Vanilla planifolia TaxID=51239 RepID=A0A835RJR9_VANPL|nr:hypothetical protein HPP92_004589 [Vanilla planifolia]